MPVIPIILETNVGTQIHILFGLATSSKAAWATYVIEASLKLLSLLPLFLKGKNEHAQLHLIFTT
ncbi:hypothetical protein I79_025635 [Cricetulus griseus]|uniref:Uncharacterized protein n=1 Tax=Cricetulus griseus TaxID=10029 RepID=G3INU5_CRIGR|nr:hypothetical protein I79_025635 [Cricetulus griseus]